MSEEKIPSAGTEENVPTQSSTDADSVAESNEKTDSTERKQAANGRASARDIMRAASKSCNKNFWNMFRQYFKFKGTASPVEYWQFANTFLVWTAFGIYVLLLCSALIATGIGIVLWILMLLVLLLFVFALICPIVSAQVRRLHDTGLSGWWILLELIPVYGIAILAIPLSGPSVSSGGKGFSLKDCIKNFGDVLRHKYCRFKGTASFDEYWQFATVCFLLTCIWVTIYLFIALIFLILGPVGIIIDIVLAVLFFVAWAAAFLLPLLGAQYRRVHDIGISEWVVVFCNLASAAIVGELQLNVYLSYPPAAETLAAAEKK